MSSQLSATSKPFVPAAINEMDFISTPIPTPDKSALEYPFSYIKGSENNCDGFAWGWDTNNFTEGVLSEEKCDAGNFPNNIVEFYWIHEGHNDEDAWELLCKLDNGNFAFYSAWCDYTGFDCRGGMKLIVSKDLRRLFYDGMSESNREKCLKDKLAHRPPVTITYPSPLARARVEWPIPVTPIPSPESATRAFIRVWEDDKELILNLDYVNGLEIETLEYAIRGLTAQFLTSKPLAHAAPGTKPKKKYYLVDIFSGTSVRGVDDYFKKRFGNPKKKWVLRMPQSRDRIVRKWGKVEVSFVLY
jgi:hypothetical protein